MIDSLYGLSGGGTETHLSYLAKYLPKERFDCLIVTFDSDDTAFVRRIRENGTPVLYFPVGRYYTLNALRQALKIKNLIRGNRIDIIQTFHFKSNTYGSMIAKLSGVKHTVSSKRDVGDNITRWERFLLRVLRGFIGAYIVVADKVGEIIIRDEHVQPGKITKIYNGVDANRFYQPTESEKHAARQKFGFSKEDFIVGMVAVFRPEKNHDVFFKAIKKAAEKIENLRAIAVGGGPLLEQHKRLVQSNGLGEKVVFTGPTGDVLQYLHTFDVACLVPGSNEGFSNSILEKMAAGLPLIVTDVGGNAEAVLDGYNGIIIPPYDSDALTDAIGRLYADPALRKEMGHKSRERVEQHFTLKKMVKNHEKFYEELVSRNQ